jgi:NADPH:quinone reductase-like Zn-dependent oxidoreductase
MKAIVQHEYGAPQDVLRLAEVKMPVAGAEDVLVSARASSATPWDWHFIRGEPLLLRPGLGGVRKPKFPVPGGDLAGTVERAGGAVTAFRPGDEVYGFGHGAFAEYVAVLQGSLAPKPGNLTFEQAAAVPMAAVTALQGLRAGGIRPGQHVLIIGASGGVGTFAVQIARHLGVTVTGVCSTRHVDLVRRLGAEAVIDYTTQDVTAGVVRYDLAFQLGGTYSPAAVRKVLTPRGTLIQSFGDGSRWFGPVGNILKGRGPQPAGRPDPEVIHRQGHRPGPPGGRRPHRVRPYHPGDRPDLPAHRRGSRGGTGRGGQPGGQGHRRG